jgi:hypothetical protein
MVSSQNKINEKKKGLAAQLTQHCFCKRLLQRIIAFAIKLIKLYFKKIIKTKRLRRFVKLNQRNVRASFISLKWDIF